MGMLQLILVAREVRVLNVIDVGYKWIGNSDYIFGGGRNQSDIDRGRFDCSTFVHWAFDQVGKLI